MELKKLLLSHHPQNLERFLIINQLETTMVKIKNHMHVLNDWLSTLVF